VSAERDLLFSGLREFKIEVIATLSALERFGTEEVECLD
jgi:hypothetical protein